MNVKSCWHLCFVAAACFAVAACDDQPGTGDEDGGGGGFGGGVERDGGGGIGGEGGSRTPDMEVEPDEGAGGIGGETPPECGDGNVDDDEECDDGNTVNGDGCDEFCVEEVGGPECGDGNVDDGEECDDGNLEDGDGCDGNCDLEPFCGDGNVDDGEACDDGNDLNGDGCDDQCAMEPIPEGCGNGMVEGEEECDDANNANDDGCSFDCHHEEIPCAIDPDCPEGFVCGPDAICVPAPPVGGGCDDAAELAMFGEIMGTTAGAAAVHGASCGGGAGGPEAVYTFELEEAQDVCFNLGGSAYDTVLHVRADECVNPEAEIACNDDNGPIAGGLQSALTAAIEPGVTYYIFVDGFGAANGDFTLNVTPGACQPPPECEVDNDLDPDNCGDLEPFCVEGRCVGCRDAADCAGEGEECLDGVCRIPPECVEDADCPEGDLCVAEECVPDVGPASCDEPAMIAVGDVVEGATVGHPAEERGQCAGNGAEAIFQLTPVADGVLCLNTFGSGYDTALHVRTVCDDPASEVACQDDRFDIGNGTRAAIDLEAVADTTYFVYVDGFAANIAGAFRLAVTDGPCAAPIQCVEDADCGADEVCVDEQCVAIECVEDADCGEGEACIDNACVFVGDGGTCDDPGVVALLGEAVGVTAGEGEHAGSCGGDAQSPEVVYMTSFDEAGTVCFDLTGSDYDTVLYVRGACDDPDSELGCNDDNRAITGGTQSALSLEVAADTPYYVFVDGFSGFGATSSGGYVLNVTPGECEAPALGCEDDDECLGSDRCVDGECVECAEDVDCPDGTVCNGANVCVECMADEQCEEGLVCNDVGTCVECNGDDDCAEGVCDEEANACVECVEDADCAEGVCEANACVECREDADCGEGEACAGDVCMPDVDPSTCDAPEEVGLGVWEGFTEGESAHRGSCGGGGPEDVLSAELEAGAYCANLRGSAYDTLLYVRTDCADDQSELACDDDTPEIAGGVQSAVTFELAEAGTAFIFVDGFAGAGIYTLELSEGACEPLPECAEDADCGDGHCVDEICVECAEDAHCEDGGVCDEENECVECVEDAHCPEGVCDEEECVECVEDADCAEGACNDDSECVECVEDAHCDDGEVCVDDQCFVDEAPLTCDAPGEAGVGTWDGFTSGESAAEGSCGGGNGPEDVYGVVFDAAGSYCVNTLGSAIDTVVYVRTACDDPDSEVACDDDNFAINPDEGRSAAVTIEVADPGQAYFIFVDGFGVDGGAYTVTISDGACAPPPVCEDDAGCDEGESCLEGQCVDCIDDAGCDEGFHCDEANACVACLADEHCGDDEVCIEGACVEPPECVEDADCAEGNTCRGNRCIPQMVGSCEEPRMGDFGSQLGFTEGVGEVGGSCGGGVESPEDVWLFEFDEDQEVCFDTRGTEFDSVLYIRTACDDPQGEVACNDDNNAIAGQFRSAITLNAAAATAYYVYVDGFTGFGGGNGGVYQLNVTPGPCVPPPECVDDGGCPEGDFCLEGSCVDCLDDDACGADEICFENVCQPRPECIEDNDCRLGFLCIDNECVEDQRLCDQAKPAGFGTTGGATAGPSSEAGSCGGGNGPEDVYVANFEAAGTVCVSTAGSGYDTLLHVRTGCDDPDSEVACNDDRVGLQAQLELEVMAETDYFIFVDGFAANGGDYTLTIVEGACPACVVDAQCGDGQCHEGECVECLGDEDCDGGRCNEGNECVECIGDGDCAEGLVCLGEACIEPPACGNGEMEFGEECDDGNVDNGDGCDAECSIEMRDLIRGRHQMNSRFAMGSSDTWRFTADGQSTVVLTTEDLAAGDCGEGYVLTLGTGEEVIAQAMPNGECPRIEELLEAGDYWARVTGDGGLANYDLGFALDQDVSAGGDYAGAFVEDGNDWYTITTAEERRVGFTTHDGLGACPGDTRLRLLNEAGEEVAFNDDGGPGACSMIDQVVPAGTWSLVADGFGGRAIEAYTLSVMFGGECGDGELNLGEACDDGNIAAGDGCDAECQIEPFCGDGEVNQDEEECDDGNIEAGDGCDENCLPEFECGDGELEGPEACDDGNLDNGDGCDSGCGLEVFEVLRGSERRDGQFPAGSTDSFFLTVDHTMSRLRAETGDGAGACPAGDTRITVYPILEGARGDQVAFNDDGGAGFCSLVDLMLPAGRYEVLIDGFGGGAHNGYVVDLSVTVDVSAGGDFDGATPDGGDDWYVFTVEEDTEVTLETGDGEGGCPDDTFLSLFAADDLDTPITTDDDDGEGFCSLVVDQPIAAGDYVVIVRGFANNQVDPYVLSVSFPAEGEPECGDGVVDDGEACDDGNLDNGDGCDAECTIEDFDIIVGLDRREGGFAPGSRDNFRIVADGPSIVRAQTSDGEGGCPAGADTRLAIHPLVEGVPGPAIASNDDGGGNGFCSLIEGALLPAAGEYLIVVDGFGGAGVAAYTLDVAHFTPVGGAGGDFPGAFVEDGNDIFGFQLLTGATVTVETHDGAAGCPGDTRITFFRVLDDQGNREQIGFNDDGGFGACSLLEIDLPPGVYSAEVDGFGGRAIDGYVARATVTPAECGNGEVEIGEQCDDGNLDNGDGCDAICSNEVFAIDRGRVLLPGGFAEDATDTFTFRAENAAHLTVSTGDGAGGCPGDTFMTLFRLIDDGREVVDTNDDGGPDLCSLLDLDIEAGAYEVVVNGFGGGSVPGYQLAFELTYDVLAGGDFLGGFGDGGNDLFVFTIEEGADVMLETGDGEGGCPADTVMVLRLDGEDIANNDDGGQGFCSLIEQALEPGSYEVMVRGFGLGGAAVPDYVLSVNIGAPDPVAPVAGDLVITEVAINPAGPGEQRREWFEVYVSAAAPILLRGIRFEDDEGQSFHIDRDLVGVPGEYLVIASRPNPEVNGGVENVTFSYGGLMALRNGSDGIRVRAPGDDGVIIDEIAWDASWPRLDGATAQLGSADPAAVDNNDGALWCPGTDAYGPNDLGTPGEANNPCPLP